MRSLATAIEAYAVDANSYPQCNNYSLPCARSTDDPVAGRILERLSTPIAYITSGIMPDPFFPDFREYGKTSAGTMGTRTGLGSDPDSVQAKTSIKYVARWELGFADIEGDERPLWWITFSSGPDRVFYNLGSPLSNIPNPVNDAGKALAFDLIYDPTNGTISDGDIYNVGGTFIGIGAFFGNAVEAAK